MSPEKEKALFDEFSNLYRGRFLKINKNLMCAGFACNDGWYELIRNLSLDINEIAKREGLKDKNYPMAFQVKEKFGGLRFYLSSGTIEAIRNAIDKAEEASYKICEKCGKSGKIRDGAWIFTLCDQCYNEGKDYGNN